MKLRRAATQAYGLACAAFASAAADAFPWHRVRGVIAILVDEPVCVSTSLAGGDSDRAFTSEIAPGLKPSARPIFAWRIGFAGQSRFGRLSCGFCSLQHALARIPLSGAAGSGRSRFDVFGVTGLESTGIDQHFPRTCDAPSVHAVFRAIERDDPPGDSPGSVSTRLDS